MNRAAGAVIALSVLSGWLAAAQGIVVFGRVSRPDGKPASRVQVRIEGLSGLQREVLTDDQGMYWHYGIPGGRYRLTVNDPNDPLIYTDPVEADSARSFANRLQVHIYLRRKNETDGESKKPGVVSVAEAAQQIPRKARKAYEDGQRFRAEKKPDRALQSFSEAITLYPTYFQALTERGELRLERKETEAAVADFELALKANAEYAPALRATASIRMEQGKFDEAIEYFDRALAIEPKNAGAHLMHGYANLLLDRREPARESLSQALRLDPAGAARAHVYLSNLLTREGRFKEAADEMWAYLKDHPDAPDAAKLRSLEIQLRALAATKPK
jgi:tetratricopeptide (TPR) repeat protein